MLAVNLASCECCEARAVHTEWPGGFRAEELFVVIVTGAMRIFVNTISVQRARRLKRMPVDLPHSKKIDSLTPLLHVPAGAALADQIVGSKAYRNHACTLIMLAVAIAQFTITGLLPLSSDLFFILGASA